MQQEKTGKLNLNSPTSVPQLSEVVIPFCPTVRPTEKEFENFYEYIEKLQATYKDHSGIVKVIPPKTWKAHDQHYQLLKQQMKVKKPIEQHAKMAKNDFYQIRNIIQQSMNLGKFQKRIADKNAISLTSPEQIQQQFWKTIKYTPPVYGADLHKSLMSTSAGSWNLADLDSLLKDAAPVLIKGVTYPYCYVGTWKSIFCWHKEDLDLSAINYLHQGHEKYWYAIQPDHQYILEEEARQAFPQSYLNCKYFLRHKTTLINPYRLKQKNPHLKVTKAHQGPNEFIVVFSGSYHCGFNSGKNIAEAVNFATKDWLKKLEGVTFCECTQNSVRPDYKFFLDNLESKASRFRNDPSLKHLKNWVVSNGLYTETTAEEEYSGEYQDDEDENENDDLNKVKSPKKKKEPRLEDKTEKKQTKIKTIKKKTKNTPKAKKAKKGTKKKLKV